MSPKIKNIILFTVIGGLMIAGYLYFFAGGEEAPQLLEEGAVATSFDMPTGDIDPAMAGDTTADFLPVLLNVKGIKLDDAIFTDPSFNTLRDSSILLVPDGTEGRPNPFAPIGFEIISASANGVENDISPAPNRSSATPFTLSPTTTSTSTTKTPTN